jgi:hypothetical protein
MCTQGSRPGLGVFRAYGAGLVREMRVYAWRFLASGAEASKMSQGVELQQSKSAQQIARLISRAP